MIYILLAFYIIILAGILALIFRKKIKKWFTLFKKRREKRKCARKFYAHERSRYARTVVALFNGKISTKELYQVLEDDLLPVQMIFNARKEKERAKKNKEYSEFTKRKPGIDYTLSEANGELALLQWRYKQELKADPKTAGSKKAHVKKLEDLEAKIDYHKKLINNLKNFKQKNPKKKKIQIDQGEEDNEE